MDYTVKGGEKQSNMASWLRCTSRSIQYPLTEEIVQNLCTHFLLTYFQAVGFFAGKFHCLLEQFDAVQEFVDASSWECSGKLDGTPIPNQNIFIIDLNLGRMFLGCLSLDMIARNFLGL